MTSLLQWHRHHRILRLRRIAGQDHLDHGPPGPGVGAGLGVGLDGGDQVGDDGAVGEVGVVLRPSTPSTVIGVHAVEPAAVQVGSARRKAGGIQPVARSRCSPWSRRSSGRTAAGLLGPGGREVGDGGGAR